MDKCIQFYLVTFETVNNEATSVTPVTSISNVNSFEDHKVHISINGKNFYSYDLP